MNATTAIATWTSLTSIHNGQTYDATERVMRMVANVDADDGERQRYRL